METKIFYRVANIATQDGLWYNQQGQYTGLIHNEYNFLSNHALEMPEDKEIMGFLSVADSLEHLSQWFTKEDMERLREKNYHLYSFLSSDYKYYKPFEHNVINLQTTTILQRLN